MQGRLCDQVDGKIQAFPWRDWDVEFKAAASIGLHLMEWTLDQDRLYENPLMHERGRERIRFLSREHKLSIPSLTGDCFMQAPFWKKSGAEKKSLQEDFLAIVAASGALGIQLIVVPLVDNGRIENSHQEDDFVDFLLVNQGVFLRNNLQVIFESDYAPEELARFIARLPATHFGINYDIGNSAALGFDPMDDFQAYGNRILNVHVKDRVLGGTTVPLAKGSANFEVVFSELAKVNYRGNFILQTARAVSGKHIQALANYYDMTSQWLKRYGLAGVE